MNEIDRLNAYGQRMTREEYISKSFKSTAKNNRKFHEQWEAAAVENGEISRRDDPIAVVSYIGQMRRSVCLLPEDGDTIILCGSGPSFRREIDALNEVKETPIWVANRCLDTGFTNYKAAAVADVQFQAGTVNAPKHDPGTTEGKVLFSGLYASPEYAKSWRGRRVWHLPITDYKYEYDGDDGKKHTYDLQRQVAKSFLVARGGWKLWQRYEHRLYDYPGWIPAPTGGNVTTGMLGIARVLNRYRKFIFVGHDMAFTDEECPSPGDLWGTDRCPIWKAHPGEWTLDECVKPRPGETIEVDVELKDGAKGKQRIPLEEEGCPICGGIPIGDGRYKKTKPDYWLYKEHTEERVAEMLAGGMTIYRTGEGALFIHHVSRDGVEAGSRWPLVNFTSVEKLLSEGVIR